MSRDISLSTSLPTCGNESLEIDPAAWPALQDHVTAISVRLVANNHPADSRALRLIVITLENGEIPISICASDTVENLKAMIQDRGCIPIDEQRLIHAGKQLEDRRLLSDYGIQQDAKIHLVLRLRGGKPIIYVFTPTTIDAFITLSLTPNWSFSAIYLAPTTQSLKGDSIAWHIRAQPDGTLRCQDTKTDVAYLYWEAL